VQRMSDSSVTADSKREPQWRDQIMSEAGLDSQLIASIIVPHYNDIQRLSDCLASLTEQTVPAHRYEIIVADNNSTCGLAAVERVCAGRAKVVSELIPGAGEARNAGIRASRGRYLAFTDSDCRPAHDWLERGLAALTSSDMIGGCIDLEISDPRNLTAVEAFELVFAFNNKRYVEEVGFSVTANVFMPRAVFAKVGGFRVGVSEDRDWGLRWTYASDVRVSHRARRDWEGLRRKWQRLARESYSIRQGKDFWPDCLGVKGMVSTIVVGGSGRDYPSLAQASRPQDKVENNRHIVSDSLVSIY
jgi:glycosyltransferase involved in cell wall biosynthesis